jgi:hypothetical protein
MSNQKNLSASYTIESRATRKKIRAFEYLQAMSPRCLQPSARRGMVQYALHVVV